MRRSNRSPREMSLSILTGFAVFASIAASPGTSAANWPTDPNANVPICVAADDQIHPEMISDRAGGAIIAWTDRRNKLTTDFDIYAQRVLPSGVVHPSWPANGRAICTAGFSQTNLKVVEDGAEGAIVLWTDSRSGHGLVQFDIYAHHVLADGSVDPAWPANGVAVCVADSTQFQILAASDGEGGALVCWTDLRTLANRDIYAAHILSTGTLDPSWPANGLAVCTAPGDQTGWSMVSDPSDAVIVVWDDSRSGASDIYAQRILPTGVVDPTWPVNGAPVNAYAGSQVTPDAAPDGAGGAFVAWVDNRGASADVYSAHLLATGVLDPSWPVNGRPLCTASGHQRHVAVTEAAPGEAIVVWTDQRWGSFSDIYAQRVTGPGGAWPIDGTALCTAYNDQSLPSLASDELGGVIVAWQDHRVSGSDIYALHLTATGEVDADWPLDGRALSTAVGSQQEAKIIADGSGGAIVTWYDGRPGGLVSDIYAQSVRPDGQLSGAVVDVPAQVGLDFVLESIHPNPSRGTPLTVRFSLGTNERVCVELVDLAGRRVSAHDMGVLGPGRHAIELAPTSRIPAGLYFVRVLAGSSSLSRSAVILE